MFSHPSALFLLLFFLVSEVSLKQRGLASISSVTPHLEWRPSSSSALEFLANNIYFLIFSFYFLF